MLVVGTTVEVRSGAALLDLWRSALSYDLDASYQHTRLCFLIPWCERSWSALFRPKTAFVPPTESIGTGQTTLP